MWCKTISVSAFSSDVRGRLTIKILANVGNTDRLEVDLRLDRYEPYYISDTLM